MAPSLLGAPETSLSRAQQGWQPWGQQAVREATGNSSGQTVPSLPRTAGERTRCSGLRSARPPCHPPLPPPQGKCHQCPGWGSLPWPGVLVAPLISTRNSGQLAFQEPFLQQWVMAHSQGLGGCVTPDESLTSLGLHFLTCRMEKIGHHSAAW